MNIEEAIKILEACSEIPYYPREAFKMAIDAMREKQSSGNILSLDELRNMAKEGRRSTFCGMIYYEPFEIQPVYLETKDAGGYGSVTLIGEQELAIWWVGFECEDVMSIEEYGKTWFAYRRKPCEDGGPTNETD